MKLAEDFKAIYPGSAPACIICNNMEEERLSVICVWEREALGQIVKGWIILCPACRAKVEENPFEIEKLTDQWKKQAQQRSFQ